MSRPSAPDAVTLQAAQWFVLLASGEADANEHARWQAWRAAHPAHEQAWQRAQGCAAPFTGIEPTSAAAALHALKAVDAPAPARRRTLGQLAVLLGAGVLGWHGYRRSDWSADILTRVGEQRDLVLPDGSRLVLDTSGAADLAFSATARIVRLRRGRVLIETAPDALGRPFSVETAQGKVRALGTRFTVQQDAGSTRVAVLEARVAVRPHAVAGEGAILEAGQAVRFGDAGILDRAVAPAGAQAWTRGMLLADDMRLGDLVAELARYRTSPLTCDPAAGALRVSGAFPLRDAGRALAAVSAALPVRIERAGETIQVSRR